MLQTRSKSDLQTLFNLAERKTEAAGGYLTICRTPLDWKVAPCRSNEIESVTGYESLQDALTRYLIGAGENDEV